MPDRSVNTCFGDTASRSFRVHHLGAREFCAKAKRRYWLTRPAFAHSCAAPSSASARRRRLVSPSVDGTPKGGPLSPLLTRPAFGVAAAGLQVAVGLPVAADGIPEGERATRQRQGAPGRREEVALGGLGQRKPILGESRVMAGHVPSANIALTGNCHRV
jgi:hypothetical protein